jgi:nitrate/nitrite-specific signal transduction histidine kinase
MASSPSFGERLGRFFRFLLRLVILLFFLAVLSLVLYLTLPWLYQRFIRPVEQNTTEVRQLQTQQAQTEQEMADLQARLEAMEDEQNQNGESFTELDERLTEIEEEISARTESLETLERMLSDLEGQNEANSVELERQINLLKAMELLSRARLSMYQSNFGLAREDVEIARDLLATVQLDAPESLAEELDAVVLRLDMVLSNLPDFPVAAADDLDIAWQILLSGLPQPTPTPMETTTPTPEDTVSATPSAIATLTPMPAVTRTPTTTP